MKKTQTGDTPTIRIIDGQPFVRVIDLAHLWNTSTASILAIGKPHHVPEEQLQRIDGRVWCSFQGLRYRVQATKHGSSIAGRIREFLDAQEEKPTEPEPAATDLGTAALIADARRTASQALAKAQDLDALFRDSDDAAWTARDLAQKNAERLEKLEKSDAKTQKYIKYSDSNAYDQIQRIEKLDDRIAAVETRQGGMAVQLTRLENRQHWTVWTLAVMATVQALAAIVRLARR